MAKNYQTGLIITGDAKGAVKATKLAGDELNKLNRRNKKYARESAGSWDRAQRSLFSLKGAIGAVTSAMVVMQGVRFLDSMIKEQEQLQRQLLRTQAIIKSTNSAAGFSAKELHEQARQAAFATLQSTDGIMQAQQIMLTFKAVTGETFTRAMALANDLSVTIGGNLNSAVTQLGKALQDPVKGMSAMAKSGVSFSEESQALIKSLVDTNQLAKAQGVILDELAGQYQGIAENEAKGLSGAVDTLGQRIEEFKINLDSNESRMAKWVDVVNLAADAVLYLDEAINGINISSVAGMDKQLSKYQAELAVLEEKAKKLDNWFGNNIASTSQENINNEIIAKNQEINSLLTKRAKLLSAIEQKKTEMANQPVQVENSLADSELARVAALLKSIETPQQKYNQSVIELNTFLAAGAITQQEYNLALELYSEQLASVTEKTDTLSDSFERQLSRLIEQNIRLSSGERALFTYQLAQKGFTAEQKKTALAIYDANKAMEKQKKSAGDASKVIKKSGADYTSQLLQIDNHLTNIRDNGATAFDGMKNGIGGLASVFDDLSTSMSNYANDIALNKTAWDDYVEHTKDTGAKKTAKMAEFAGREKKLQAAVYSEGISGASKMFGVLSSMYEQQASAAEDGSRKQAKAHEKALEMKRTEAIFSAISGIMNALQGDPYTAIPRAIITAAFAASQLAQIDASISTNAANMPSALSESQGKGTVLGQPDKVSESLGNSIKGLQDYAKIGNSYSSNMLIELTNISRNTAYLNKSLSNASGLNAIKNIQHGGLGGGGLTRLLGGFSSKRVTSDYGVIFDKDKTLQDIRDTADLGAQYFETSYKKVSFLFGSIKGKYRTQLFDIEPEIAKSFGKLFQSSYDAIIKVGNQIFTNGLPEEVVTSLNALTLKDLGFDAISFKGMKPEEIEQALNGVISAGLDKMTATAFPSFDEFQTVGEGLFETVIRVTSAQENASNALMSVGIESIKLTDVLYKQSDIGEQLVKQSIERSNADENVKEVMRSVTGSADELISTYKKVNEIQRLLVGSGFGNNVNLDDAAAASGGEDAFKSNLESYRQNFMTDSQRFQADLNDMATDFKTLGVVFPDNINDYTKAVTAAGFDIRTATQEFMKGVATPEDLGRTLQLADVATQLYSDWGRLNEVLRENTVVLQQTYDRLGQSDIEKTLRGIAESFTDSIVSISEAGGTAEQMLQALNLGLLTAGDAIEKAKKSIDDLYKGIYKNIADQKTSLSDAITKLVDPDALFQIQADRYTALLENGSYEEQMQAARSLQELIISQYQEQGDTITNMIDSVKQIGQYLDNLKLNDTLSVLTPAQMLGDAQGQFQLQLSLARAGDADALSSITDFADTYLNKARSFYASSDTYTGIFDSVTKALGDIKAPDKEDYAKTTSAATTEAVTWLKSISASLDTIKDEQMLNQQNELSTGLSQAQGVRSEFIGGVASATNTSSGAIESLLTNGITKSLSNKKISDEVISEYANTHTFKETYDAAIANGISSIELANATGWDRKGIVDWAAQNGLEVFAGGGVSNRPAIFGEAGAEAAVPLPDGSSIPVTLSGGNNDALIEEIRALKQEVAELRREQADQTNALIESNYDANEQAAEKVSSTQEDVSWRNTQQVEIA